MTHIKLPDRNVVSCLVLWIKYQQTKVILLIAENQNSGSNTTRYQRDKYEHTAKHVMVSTFSTVIHHHVTNPIGTDNFENTKLLCYQLTHPDTLQPPPWRRALEWCSLLLPHTTLWTGTNHGDNKRAAPWRCQRSVLRSPRWPCWGWTNRTVPEDERVLALMKTCSVKQMNC